MFKSIFKIICFLLFILFVHEQICFSQVKKQGFYEHEFSFGMGYANGFEKHVFNVPYDAAVNSALSMNLNYCYFLNPEIGIGARVFGYYKALPEFIVIGPTGTQEKIKFTLQEYNGDAELRYVFKGGEVEPYGFLLMGYTHGTVDSEDESLSLSGFNAGAGAGIRIPVGKQWRISFELFGTVGSAKWEKKPFLNSTSDDFKTSMAGILVNVSYLWGFKKGK